MNAWCALVAVLAVYRLMGRDYEAAVMSSGLVGFMLGTTANAMAKKGRIRPGADGDLTLFDPATVIDRATY